MKALLAFRFVTAVLFSGAMKGALAAHPLVTDDTGTQGRGNSQLEINSDRARFEASTIHVASFTYTYGVREDLDIFSTLPASVVSPSGINDASLGAKWRFWDNQQTSLALKPELFLPTGDEHAGLGTGRTSTAVALLGSHQAGEWTFHGNVGVSINRYKLPSVRQESRKVIWRTSVAAAYELSDRWTLVADTGVARNLQKAVRKNPAFILFGLIYAPRPDVDLDVGVKVGLNSAEVKRQVGAGVTLRF